MRDDALHRLVGDEFSKAAITYTVCAVIHGVYHRVTVCHRNSQTDNDGLFSMVILAIISACFGGFSRGALCLYWGDGCHLSIRSRGELQGLLGRRRSTRCPDSPLRTLL